MDIQTELRQLELMDPRHDNIYARVLDWMASIQREADEAKAEFEKDCRYFEREEEKAEEELKELRAELKAKNAEIDRLVALVDSMDDEMQSLANRALTSERRVRL